MQQENKNIHEGHRKRLRQRFDQVGLDGFSEHEILELILFQVIPRRDTKPLAHELINHFGNLAEVLDASKDELMQVPGVGEAVASFLCLFSAVNHWQRKQGEKPEKVILNTSAKAGSYLSARFRGRTKETLIILCMTSDRRVLYCDELGSGVGDSVTTTLREVARLCMKKNTHDIILAHNHPSGLVLPSREDITMTRRAQDFLKDIGVKLHDHFVITDGEYYSMKDHKLF